MKCPSKCGEIGLAGRETRLCTAAIVPPSTPHHRLQTRRQSGKPHIVIFYTLVTPVSFIHYHPSTRPPPCSNNFKNGNIIIIPIVAAVIASLLPSFLSAFLVAISETASAVANFQNVFKSLIRSTIQMPCISCSQAYL